MAEGSVCTTCSWSRTGENPMSGILERVQETWIMEEAKRARTVETPKQPSFHLRLRAPELYSPISAKPSYDVSLLLRTLSRRSEDSSSLSQRGLAGLTSGLHGSLTAR